MTPSALLDLCVAAYKQALAREHNLPPAEQARAAMASALRVAAARSPGVAAWLETNREATQPVDELLPRRLRDLAMPTIEATARQASAETGGDVTPELLTGPASYRWLTPWRDLAWWRLSREGMTERQMTQVFAASHGAIGKGVRRYEARVRGMADGATEKLTANQGDRR